MRPAGGAADLDRLRRQLGLVLARALRAPRSRRRDRRAGARGRSAGGRCRDRPLGHVPAQARRDAVGARRSRADREAGRLALRLRGLGDRLPDAADRAQRALGCVAADAADSDRRALPGERASRSCSRLAARGGRPALLVSSEPFTGGDAAAWWKSIGAVSDLVLENYANANLIWRDGRGRRLAAAAGALSAVGREAARARDPAVADRDHDRVPDRARAPVGARGSQPRSRWFSVAKWQALAVRQVARELRLAHVWSWGWAQRDERSNDPDKTYAACVWLWARDPGLCDAPGVLGREFDADRKTGQLDLPSGTRCMYGSSAAHGVERRGAREGDERSRARADRARRARDRA